MKPFRHWLHEKWLEHQLELESYNQPVSYDLRTYFARYKYWLRRIYRASQPGVQQ
jgi:hypothetical protein